MMQPNFNSMSDSELKSYILQNPDDIHAFYAYVDRMHAANPNPVLMTVEEAEVELERRIEQGQR
jgi:hypothetical protein